jgi:hypothetical protein
MHASVDHHSKFFRVFIVLFLFLGTSSLSAQTMECTTDADLVALQSGHLYTLSPRPDAAFPVVSDVDTCWGNPVMFSISAEPGSEWTISFDLPARLVRTDELDSAGCSFNDSAAYHAESNNCWDPRVPTTAIADSNGTVTICLGISFILPPHPLGTSPQYISSVRCKAMRSSGGSEIAADGLFSVNRGDYWPDGQDGFLDSLLRGHTYTLSPLDTGRIVHDRQVCRIRDYPDPGSKIQITFTLPRTISRDGGGTLLLSYPAFSAAELVTGSFWDADTPATLTVDASGMIDISLGFQVTVPDTAIPGYYQTDCLITVAYASNKVGELRTTQWSALIGISVLDKHYPVIRQFTLLPNYPNPFNGTTTIPFTLPQAGHVTMTVYDLLGREVSVLADRDFPAGEHTVAWQVPDNSGPAGGVYFCRVRQGNFTAIRRLLLLR